MDKDHYDLFDLSGSKVDRVLIVSPYVEPKFFAEVARRLRPRLMVVVIDDGCRPEDVEMVRKSALSGTTVQVVLGAARGLTHMKLYYVLSAGEGRKQPEQRLVWGSGNATQQAFQGNINAELMCRASLNKDRHQDIISWLTKVARKAADVNKEEQLVEGIRSVEIAEGVHIRLPDLVLRSTESKATNFDLWLQRGRIVAIYRPDASFLRVSVTLLKDIPQGPTANRISKLVDTPSRRNIGIRYLKGAVLDNGDTGDDKIVSGEDKGTRWRAPFCVWTAYGEWCSDACFKEKEDHFQAAKPEERQRNLDALEKLRDGQAVRRGALKHYLETLDGLYNAFGPNRAKNYLHCDSNGNFDRKFYQKLFEDSVKRDLVLSKDKEFCGQYISGCEVSDVPRFRADPTAWENFVDSFSRHLCKEARKPFRASGRHPSQSRLVRRLQDVVDNKDVFRKPKDLTKLLRNRWEKLLQGKTMTLGQYLDGYQDQS